MNQLPRSLAALALLLSAAPARPAEVILNEIMYHPQSENVFEEYIELYNRGTNTVNLHGWRFTRGIECTLSNVTLAPGAYLVVPSHLSTFQGKYPGVLNVTAGWNGSGATTNFVLSNGREEIRLVNAAGQEEDSVTYADEGDWGTRRVSLSLGGARGVEWYADHDGLGKSLELRNPLLANAHGQNWASSVTFNGTPGVVNSARTSNIAPMILEARHEPPVPRSTDTVAITARILDELTNGLTVRLWFRTHNTTSPGSFVSTNLFDDGLHRDSLAGDGIYGAVLPAMADATLVEFYLEASDPGSRTRTWPAPTVVATDQSGPPTQSNNAVYQVDNGTYGGSQPVFRVVQTETDRAAYEGFPDGSDAQANLTFVTTDGTGTEVRYLCGRRTRGAGSRNIDPRGNRLNVPRDTPWNGVTELNINSQYPHLQLVGSYLALKSGMVAASATAIQYRVNGANTASSGLPQLGSWVYIEPLNGDWAARHMPGDGDGNVYRASTPGHNADLSYDPDVSYYLNRGYSKTSNSSENDWTDLIALTDALNNSSDENFVAAVSQRLNPQMWMRYFAFMSMCTSLETSIALGRGDDYSMYRGMLDTRFILLPHDLDTILGRGDTSPNVNANLFRMINPPNGNAVVPALNRFMTNNAFVWMYYAELHRLLDTTFAPEQINPLIDSLLLGWADPEINAMKNNQAMRNDFVRSQIPLSLTVTSALPVVSGYPQTTSPTLSFNGGANVIQTRAIKVNGLPADWLNWRGTWTITDVPATPGLNRVLIQAFTSNDVEIARTTLDIWYDDGTLQNASGTLPADATWTASGGPYNISANLTIPAGRTLSIDPGTTIYVANGVTITVNGGLVADGTATQRIRFTRAPGSTGAWGGLVFNGSNAGSSFSHVDFEHVNTTGRDNIQLINSSLAIDSCSWSSTTNTILEASNSSFTVRSSVFPTLNGAEHIHGGPIPAGGYAIIDGNVFGGTAGLNDIIDFSGAQRPGPVLQVLNNVFTAATDDVLDLDGTDAHIEGNVFMRVHKNNTGPGDTSSAISYGQSGGYGPHIVAVRNLFYDVDHVALCKEGGYLTLVNNTAVGINIAAVNFSEPERNTVPGVGATIDGNIFHNPAGYAGTNLQNRFPTNGTVVLVVRRNIFSSSDGVTNGVDNNLVVDPRLVNTDTNTISAASIWRDFALRSGSPASGTGPNGLDRGGVVPPGASISGEPSSPTPLTGATLTVGGPGISNYIYRVNGAGWSGEFPVNTPITLSSLGNGSYTVEVRGRNSAGVLQSAEEATASRTWTVNTALTRLLVSEVLARNATVLSIEGETPDLIELWNAGANTVDLSDVGLTDDPTQPYKFTFPQNTPLDPGDRLVVFADAIAAAGFWTGFGLDQDGDALYIFDKPANGGALLDSVVFGPQLADRSIGRMADGSWTLTTPTFGSANVSAPVGDVRRLKVNEWLANALAVFPTDFIEIYNPDSLPVDLGGLYLTDEPAGMPTRHEILPLSFVAPGGHVVFRADDEAAEGANHLGFKLSAGIGAIALFASDLTPIDCIYYEPQYTDLSEGRRPSGGSTISLLSTPTPGAANPGLSGSTTISNFTTTIPLLRMTNSWRYDASGSNLLTAWRDTGYNDSGWQSGTALFGFDTTPGVYPIPFNTFFPAPQSNGPITAYFRTHFNVASNLSGLTITASTYLDDGAVFYFNGVEAGRLRMGGGTVLFDTTAQNQGSEGSLENVNLSGSSLVVGDNVLAVEVHQSAGNSSDSVFGMSLSATHTISVTNVTGVNVVLNELLASPGTLTNADGSITDWVEIYNPSTNTVDMSDMSLTDDLETVGPRRWVFPSGVSLAPGGYLSLKFDSSSPPSTNNGPLLNTGFGLDNNGDELYLYDALSRGGNLVDSVLFGMQAAGFSIGRVPAGSGPWQLTQPTRGGANLTVTLGNVSNLRINEWMAEPDSGDDWFEVYNPNPQPVALGGYFFTDDLGDRTKSPIRALTFIGVSTNGYAQFRADSNPSAGPDHVDFKLDKDSDLIALFPPGSGPYIALVSFEAQVKGISEGLFTDGSSTVIKFPDSSSPGESNYLPLDPIAFNEALTHADSPFEDAIELHNISPSSVDVSGWFISDDNDYLTKFRIPDGTVIPPSGFAVFYEYEFNPEPGRSYSFPLSSAKGDTLHLSAADVLGNLTGYRTSVKFGAASNGVSFGRYETSTGPDFTALVSKSLGVNNPGSLAEFRTGLGATNSGPRIGAMVITEVMYHPPDVGTNDNSIDEYIELRNISASTVQLFDPANPVNRWRLRDAVSFTFPSNRTVTAGSVILVVPFDPANASQLNAFRTKYAVSPVVAIYGPWSGKLDNGSDSVELARPDAPEVPPSPDAGLVPYFLVDKVKYSDNAPWPTFADGYTNTLGYSLHRRVNNQYGNDPVNWQAGAPTPGSTTATPVTTLPVITTALSNKTAVAGQNVTFTIAATGAAPLTYEWRYYGRVIEGETNATLVLPNVQASAEGRYSALVFNPSGAAASGPVTLSFQSLPVILDEPQDRVALAGSTVTFSVLASGTSPLRYQWSKDGSPLGNQTNASLILNNVQVANQGGYSVLITNILGAATSVVATLTINSPPSISQQPQNLTVNAGATANFSVTASGSAPLRYQWRFEGVDMPGETNFTLVINNAQGGSAGDYTVRITNAVGAVTSAAATLTVVLPPVVTVAATDANASETGPNTGAFTITRSYTTNSALVVAIALSGSATGSDYSAISSPVTIPANQASATVLVTPVDDAALEAPETVILTVQPGAGYTVGGASSATVTISDNDNQAPSVAITDPPGGSLFLLTPTNVLVSADATDSDGTVSLVEFYWQGTNKVGEASAAPYTITWTNASAGSNALTAVATDNLTRRGTSAPVFIVLNALPTVSVTNPLNNASFVASSNIKIDAAATDSDGTVTQVMFFADSTPLGADVSSPYSVTWNSVAAGNYVLTARATDDRGAVRTSAGVNISVVTVVPILTNIFANRVTITGTPHTILANSQTGATTGVESGEPTPTNSMTRTMWIAWTAPVSAQVVMDTFGSSYNTTLGAYTGTAVNALTTVAFNNDAAAGIQSQISFNAVAGTTYNIQVGGISGGPGSGSIVFHITVPNQAPTITTQPQSQTVNLGANVTFTVAASGATPFNFQWLRNGVDIGGATSSNLTLNNVNSLNEGAYSVRVSNTFGNTNSASATLTVNDGLVTTYTTQLISFNNTWRYNQAGVDLGTSWREPGFNDAGWDAGQSLLAYELITAYPEPFRTTLNISNGPTPINTYYFRTHFTLTNDSSASVTLVSTNLLDDGAVYYLNGTEVGRIRMPNGAVDYNTLGFSPQSEGAPDTLPIPSASRVQGDNVMAVEVHQSSVGSSDVAFGMSLHATVTFTNRPSIVNPQVLGNGSFRATLVGIPGRRYAVEFKPTLGGSWTQLILFTNQTSQTIFTDPGAASAGVRFYRGRLAP